MGVSESGLVTKRFPLTAWLNLWELLLSYRGKDRFYESIINAASVYGEIHLTKHNIRILFNKYISFEDTATSVGLVGDEEPNSVGLVGSPPQLSRTCRRTQSDLSEALPQLSRTCRYYQLDLSETDRMIYVRVR